jgi:hypothetical protein
MPSITTWNRLEPQTTADDLETGVAAPIHDPLWLLARQWQVGEFQGEDAGTPITARWRAQAAPLTRCHFGPLAPNTQLQAAKFDARAIPLETLVERQRVRQPSADDPPADGLRHAVESGQQFLRMLAAQPTSGNYRAAFVNTYAVRELNPEQRASLDPASRAYADLVTGRALDGRRLRAALAGGGGAPRIDPALGVAPGDVAEVLQVCSAWIEWCVALFSQPNNNERAWQSERMEYAFSLATKLADDVFGERTLTAEQYADGTIDWHTFDLNSEVNMGTADDDPGEIIARTVIPAPVTFRGMPAPRFWEFEDAVLDFGALQPGSTDLAQLLLIETLSGYGNDWYVIPIDLPVGSLVESRSLVVTDTFGVRTLLRPNGDPALAPQARWSIFQLAMRAESADAEGFAISNLFFLPPSLVQPMEGAPVEEVMLLRDEMANLAWAVERRLESPLGDGIDAATDLIDVEDGEPKSPVEMPIYRLASPVPPHWIPLLPVRVSETSAEVRLARASLLDVDGGRRIVRSQSQVLQDPDDPGARLLLHEEEVPREGVVVRRSYQAARWYDGQLHVWAGNRKSVGHGERSSGMRFDSLEA